MKPTFYINASALKEAACDAKFLFTVLKGWELKSFNTARMEYGTAFHYFLADYHIGKPTKECIEKAVAHHKQFEGQLSEMDFRTAFHLSRSCIEYVRQYKDDSSLEVLLHPDSNEPIVESQIAYPFYSCADFDIILTGTVDMIAEHFGVKSIVDHKTTSARQDSFFYSYDFEIQTKYYSWLLNLLYGEGYLPVVINGIFLKKATQKYWKNQKTVAFDGVAFERKSFEQIPEKMEEFDRWVRLKLDKLICLLGDTVAGDNDPLDPTNQERSFCNAHFGRCKFQSICDAWPAMRETVIDTEYIEKPYEPLTWH